VPAPASAGVRTNEEDGNDDMTATQHHSRRRRRSGRRPGVGIEVWDAVFTPDVCRELHILAQDHSERTTGEGNDEDEDEEDKDDSLDGSSIFLYQRGRPNNKSDADAARDPPQQRTPIEQALASFLDAYYEAEDRDEEDADTASVQEYRKEPPQTLVIEYWCRQEHLNLEAHADVDEVWFERSCNQRRQKGCFRYPAIGHVLYLTPPTQGVGPTCVFPPATTDNHPPGPDGVSSSSITDDIESVVIIPAVPGRVLRFPGTSLHAVPKPANVWFQDGDGASTNEDDDEEDEEEDDDEEDDDDDDDERSVILFNVWEASDDGDPKGSDSDRDFPIGPIGVPFDPMFHVDSDMDIVDMMMSSVDIDDGVEVDEDFVQGMVNYARQQKDQQLTSWRENYCDPAIEHNATSHTDDDATTNSETGTDDDQPIVYAQVHCQPKTAWKLAPIDTTATTTRRVSDNSDDEGQAAIGAMGTIRVPLMGDTTRRRYPKKSVFWIVPSSFEKGVQEPDMPSEFPLSVARNVGRPTN